MSKKQTPKQVDLNLPGDAQTSGDPASPGNSSRQSHKQPVIGGAPRTGTQTGLHKGMGALLDRIEHLFSDMDADQLMSPRTTIPTAKPKTSKKKGSQHLTSAPGSSDQFSEGMLVEENPPSVQPFPLNPPEVTSTPSTIQGFRAIVTQETDHAINAPTSGQQEPEIINRIESNISTSGSLPTDVQIQSADHPLTSAGTDLVKEAYFHTRGSLSSDIIPGIEITQNASPDTPAVLALARPYNDPKQQIGTAGLLLEFLDTDPERQWSEDEQLLVSQVADQLTLALENARLFEQATARAEEMALINRVVGTVAASLDLNHTLNVIVGELTRALSLNQVTIALASTSENEFEPLSVSPDTQDIPGPSVKQTPEHHFIPTLLEIVAASSVDGTATPDRSSTINRGATDPRIFGKYIRTIEYPLIYQALVSQRPLVVYDLKNTPLAKGNHDVQQLPSVYTIGSQGLIILPMVAQRREGPWVIGLATLHTADPNRRLTQDELRLAETIIGQASTAVQNARLFDQSERSRQALMVRERYQTSVARAVALLTERGTSSLSEVLQILGEAVGANRSYYFQTEPSPRQSTEGEDQTAPQILYWRPVAEWTSPGVQPQSEHPVLKRLSIRHLDFWRAVLEQQGYIATNIDILPPRERSIMSSIGTKSILQFAVRGKYPVPGFIGFDQTNQDRHWGDEEISALATAASSLANTLAREDLLSRLQVSLDQSQAALSETEMLYRANASINEASTYDDILDVLRNFTILGHPSLTRLSLNLFDGGSSPEKPEWLIQIAQWNLDKGNELSNIRYPVRAWSTASELLKPEEIVAIPSVENDVRIDATGRALYIDRLKAKGVLLAPLNMAGKWIGHLIAIYGQPFSPSDSDLRRLASLSDQAAVAIEGLRLLNETLQRNAEQAALNRIISAASRSLDLDQMLSSILDEVLETTSLDSGLISLYHPVRGRLELNIARGLPEGMIRNMQVNGLDNTFCQVVYERNAPLVVPDFTLPVMDERLALINLNGLLNAGYLAYLGVPLLSKGQALGTLCLLSRTPLPLRPSYYTLLQSVGTQVGVAVENASLFLQTQNALAETAALYTASAEFNAAENFDDVLATLRAHSALNIADRLVSIQLFDRPWTSANKPRFSYPITTLSNLPPGSLTTRLPITDFFQNHLEADAPKFIEDLTSDPRLDDETRQLYGRRFLGRSALFVPLVVAGQWIGYINGVYSRPTHLSTEEIRRLVALSRQVAVAVQNLNSIDLAERRAQESQQRSEELTLINRIVSAVASSIDLQTSLDTVARELGQALRVQTGIALLDETRQILRLTSAYTPPNHSGEQNDPLTDNRSQAFTLGIEIPIQGNPSTEHVFATREPLLVQDPLNNPLTAPIHGLLAERGVQALYIIPLLATNRVIGTVGLDILEPQRIFSDDEMRLARTIVIQAAVAIQNARLFNQTEQALAETESLFQASSSLNRATSFQTIIQALAEHTLLGANSNDITINLFDRPWVIGLQRSAPTSESQDSLSLPETRFPEWINVIARRSHPNTPAADLSRYRLDTLPSLKTLLNPDFPTPIADLTIDERLDSNLRRLLIEGFSARGMLFVPLVVGGQWIGFIDASYPEQLEYAERDLRLLRALSAQTGVAVQNQRLLEETRRRAGQLQTAAEIARDTSATLDLDSLLGRTVNLLLARFDYYHASVFLLDEEGENAVVQASTGLAGEEMKRRRHSLPVGSRSIIGMVTSTGKPLVVNDVSIDTIHRPNPLLPDTRAELGIPIKSAERVIGALDVQSTRANSFNPDDVTVLQILADQLAIAVENARSYQLAQKAYEEMREVDRLKSQFLANMSHELRTPLNSIIGFSRVILKGIDGPITDLQQQDLSAIYNSGQHLLNLINDVLDLSKIEAGKMELAFEDDVNLPDIIHSVMSTAVGLVKDKPIQLKREIAPDLPLVRADPLKLRQVFINLLSNAAKFTEEGSITVSAQHTRIGIQPGEEALISQSASDISTQMGVEGIIIRVSDTGPGISNEDLPKLFKPFSQVDGSLTRKVGGSGLGLSICQYLVQMHGGQIGVESEVGKGTTFFFTIPAPLQKDHGGEQGIIQQGEGRTILVVDDEPQVIHMYERFLAVHGYQVIALTDPSLVVQYARQYRPYAITLDILLPGRDGWQIMDELKRNPSTRNIPVIICSVLRDRGKGFSLGAADYLVKPILDEDLVQAIGRLNGQRDIHDILVVDDDLDSLRLVSSMFKDNTEYHLRQVAGGQQALEDIRRRKPDAVILDLFMPDPDGFKVLENLRADPQLRDLPVLVLTAGELDERQRAQLTNFTQAMLSKSLITEEELLEQVNQVLQRIAQN